MSSASLRWIALSALGLSAGVGIAVALEDPIDALVGMVLVTPVLTLLAGGILGAVQWIELRRHIERAGRWLLSTALGLGFGLAAGVVLLEVVGELLTGHPMRLLQQEPLPRALSFLILGAVSGLCLGFAQRLMLRKTPHLPSNWPLLSACGLGLGFPAGSLLADTVMSGLTSPAGLIVLVVVSGAVLGSFTARPLTRAAA
jgi:hypothetical protein